MPGMVTEGEPATLRSATGETFHRLFAKHLRAHLSQSVRVAAAASRSGIHPATTTLAAAVVRGGTTELAWLDRLEQVHRLRAVQRRRPGVGMFEVSLDRLGTVRQPACDSVRSPAARVPAGIGRATPSTTDRLTGRSGAGRCVRHSLHGPTGCAAALGR
ncbi:DUF305 domain-containing protein [Micromonospora tarapacensis]|uniref:DUF305 domain-containing protein n=1 Tax=Micromonospora tarapacensis TaxID=2835305 RepID=UPI0038B406C4